MDAVMVTLRGRDHFDHPDVAKALRVALKQREGMRFVTVSRAGNLEMPLIRWKVVEWRVASTSQVGDFVFASRYGFGVTRRGALYDLRRSKPLVSLGGKFWIDK